MESQEWLPGSLLDLMDFLTDPVLKCRTLLTPPG